MDAGDFLSSGRCTLAVIDMQNDFIHEDGAASRLGHDVSLVRAVVPNVMELIGVAREAGVPVVFVRVVHESAYDTPAWVARGRAGTTLDVDTIPIVEKDSWGAELYEGIEPLEGELVITKYRYSAFAFTPFELALRTNGSDVLVLAGTQTNVCVEATANDALFRGFCPVIVKDCVATGSLRLHEAALEDMSQRNGPLISLADAKTAWVPRRAQVVPA